MPELPEVQTVVDDLNRQVVGRRIVSVWIGERKLLKNIDPGQLEKGLTGRKIVRISRRAKNIVFGLDNSAALLVHLKMTGHFLFEPRVVGGIDPVKFSEKDYIRFALELDDGRVLGLSDLRKFASVLLFPDEKTSRNYLAKFGPDALEISLEDFKELIAGRSGRIKSFLMNQKILAGVGNIYSDEILYRARIHPLMKTSSLTGGETSRIYRAMKEILQAAIRKRGTSVADFRDLRGEEGEYGPELSVYGRVGLPCPAGKGKIERIKINGRSSYFCPAVQKLK
jgi:formamidopyrimidine-DNA glycosylase